MNDFVKVYPTKKSSAVIHDASHAPLTVDGVIWPNDTYTKRRIMDKSVSRTPPTAAQIADFTGASQPVSGAID